MVGSEEASCLRAANDEDVETTDETERVFFRTDSGLSSMLRETCCSMEERLSAIFMPVDGSVEDDCFDRNE